VRYKRAYNSGGGKVVSGMGYIVKVTPKTVSIVLNGDLFTSLSPSPINMDNIYVSHVGPYVGDDVFHVANYTLVNHFSRDLKSMDCYITAAEMSAIEKCKININDNFGIYSDKDMLQAIAKLRQVGDQHIKVEMQNSASPTLSQVQCESWTSQGILHAGHL